MGAKETLRDIIDDLTEEEAEELLDFLNMRADPDTLTPEEVERIERIRAEMDAGEYVTLQDFAARFATRNSVGETV